MWVVAHDIEKHEDRVMYRVEREAPLGSLLAETLRTKNTMTAAGPCALMVHKAE